MVVDASIEYEITVGEGEVDALAAVAMTIVETNLAVVARGCRDEGSAAR